MTASFTVTVSTARARRRHVRHRDRRRQRPRGRDRGRRRLRRARSLSGVSIPAGQTTATRSTSPSTATPTVEPDETFVVQRHQRQRRARRRRRSASARSSTTTNRRRSSTDVVISQVYGGGGNCRRDADARLHRAVQSRHRAGEPGRLVGAVHVGGRHRHVAGDAARRQRSRPAAITSIQKAQGAGGTTPLPAPDAIGTIADGGRRGQGARCRRRPRAIVGACPSAATADLVGYGARDLLRRRGAAPRRSSNTTAALRKRGGCFDSDNNSVDFSVGNPVAAQLGDAGAQLHPGTRRDSRHPGQRRWRRRSRAGRDHRPASSPASRSNGFFLQAPTRAADADPATSEGLFVFTAATPAVAVGDDVSARGTVSEFFGLTQIEGSLPGDVAVDGVGGALPAPITLTPAILDPAGTPDQLERFEGMRMHAASLTSVAPTDELRRDRRGADRRRRGRCASRASRSLDPVPPDPTIRRRRLLHPAVRREPRAHRHRQRRAGRRSRRCRDVERRHRATSPGPLDFSFGAYKLLPETPPTAGGQHERACRCRSAGGRRVHRRRLQHRELRRQRRPQRTQGGAGDPAADAVAGRHRPHRDPRSADAAGARASRSTPTPSPPGQPDPGYQAVLIPAPLGGTQNVGFLVKTSRVRIDARHAGARRRHIHQPEQRPDRDAARSAAARAPRDRRSVRPRTRAR